MSVSRKAVCCAAGALGLAAGGAHAAPLTMVNVGAPAINCVFDPSCKVVATDTIGRIPNSAPTSLGRLQSRTWAGAPGAPGFFTSAGLQSTFAPFASISFIASTSDAIAAR